MNNSCKVFLVLLALLLPALLVGLDARPVYKIQEVRIAETAREMVESGDWLVPHFNGTLRLQKPPLPYWLTAISYQLGDVGAKTTRIPSAVAGLLLALLLWFWARRELGVEIASNSVMALVVSFLGLRYFRSGEADALLLFFTSAACMLGYFILAGRSGLNLLFGLALGLGFLTKGPAALSIPLLTLLGVVVVERLAGRPRPAFRRLFSAPGIIALLATAFGWYAWIVWKLPDAAEHFVGKQIDETFISGNHAQPVWWYLARSLEFFAPWSLLFIPVGVMAYRQVRGGGELPPLVRFAWIWLGVVFVLLSATVNKQTQYALLFAPPIAILVGHYLAAAQGNFLRLNRAAFWIACVVAVAGAGFALRKSALAAESLLWLALIAVPLALARLSAVRGVSLPVLFVAAVASTAFLYGESNFSKEPRKVAAQSLMGEAAKYSPLFQLASSQGDGALSFYAGRVVRPVDAKALPALLAEHGEIWLVGEGLSGLRGLPGVASEEINKADELSLVKLTRRN